MKIRIETRSEYRINDILAMCSVENRSLTSSERDSIRALALESKRERISFNKAVDAFIYGVDLLISEEE